MPGDRRQMPPPPPPHRPPKRRTPQDNPIIHTGGRFGPDLTQARRWGIQAGMSMDLCCTQRPFGQSPKRALAMRMNDCLMYFGDAWEFKGSRPASNSYRTTRPRTQTQAPANAWPDPKANPAPDRQAPKQPPPSNVEWRGGPLCRAEHPRAINSL